MTFFFLIVFKCDVIFPINMTNLNPKIPFDSQKVLLKNVGLDLNTLFINRFTILKWFIPFFFQNQWCLQQLFTRITFEKKQTPTSLVLYMVLRLKPYLFLLDHNWTHVSPQHCMIVNCEHHDIFSGSIRCDLPKPRTISIQSYFFPRLVTNHG